LATKQTTALPGWSEWLDPPVHDVATDESIDLSISIVSLDDEPIAIVGGFID